MVFGNDNGTGFYDTVSRVARAAGDYIGWNDANGGHGDDSQCGQSFSLPGNFEFPLGKDTSASTNPYLIEHYSPQSTPAQPNQLAQPKQTNQPPFNGLQSSQPSFNALQSSSSSSSSHAFPQPGFHFQPHFQFPFPQPFPYPPQIDPKVYALFSSMVAQNVSAPPAQPPQTVGVPPEVAPSVGPCPDNNSVHAPPAPPAASAPPRFLKRNRHTEDEILNSAPAPTDQVLWQDQDDPFAVVEVVKRRCLETGLTLTKTYIEAEQEKLGRLQMKTIPRLEYELKTARETLLEGNSKQVHWNWAIDRIRRAQSAAKGQPQYKAAMDQLIGAPQPKDKVDDFIAPEGPGAEGA